MGFKVLGLLHGVIESWMALQTHDMENKNDDLSRMKIFFQGIHAAIEGETTSLREAL